MFQQESMEEVFHYEPSTLQYFDVTLEALAATHCNEYVEGAIMMV